MGIADLGAGQVGHELGFVKLSLPTQTQKRCVTVDG